MRKILIVSYYELKDYFLTIQSLFTDKYKWDVISYPLYMYCYDQNSKIEDYETHFSNFIKKESPDLILWWFTDVSLSTFKRIKTDHPSIFYVLFNFNDPINVNRSFLEKCKIFDMIMTVSKHNIDLYRLQSNVKNIEFFPMAYDELLFKPSESLGSLDSLDFSCDISFVCDALYTEYKEQVISRKDLINRIINFCKNNKYTFSLYGSEYLRSIYPNVYKGEINYIDMPSLFNNSKINIISHAFANKKLQIPHNMIPIMACGGIVLCDNVKDFDEFFNKDTQTIFLYDSQTSNLEDQMNDILKSYKSKINKINKIKSNAKKFTKNYKWENFVDLIYITYCKDRFDANFYAEMYNIKKIDDSLNIWNERHNNKVYNICYKFKVPSNFEAKDYAEIHKIDGSREMIYAHWWMNGKNMDYMRRQNKKNNCLSGASMNITTTDLFDLFRIFNMIYVHRNIDEGIAELNILNKSNPRLNINEALAEYIELSKNT